MVREKLLNKKKVYLESQNEICNKCLYPFYLIDSSFPFESFPLLLAVHMIQMGLIIVLVQRVSQASSLSDHCIPYPWPWSLVQG